MFYDEQTCYTSPMDWRSLSRHLFACRSIASCCQGCFQFWGSVFNRDVLEAPLCVPLRAPPLVPAGGQTDHHLVHLPEGRTDHHFIDLPGGKTDQHMVHLTMTDQRKVLDGSLAMTVHTHLHLFLQLMRLFLLTHLLTGIKCNTTDKIQYFLYSNTNQQSWVELVNPTFLLHNL
jgi:hypothetical protein